jgi:site-specific DNA-methyltransferase (adenine-specific)
MEPYYADDSVTLYQADFRELDGLGPAAAAVTSPPYNSGVAYDVHDDQMAPDRYGELAAAAAEGLFRALEESGGRAWINVGVTQLGTWLKALEAAAFAGTTTICWDYGVTPADTAWGSWCSPGAPHLRYGWEPVICAWTDNWRRTAPTGLQGWRDELDDWALLCRNVWRIPAGASFGSRHPAVMPIELAVRAIRLSTWPGETVVDCFAGTGTTLVAAKILGRRAVGVELSERYCEIAAGRLAQGVLSLDLATSSTEKSDNSLGGDISEELFGEV